MPKYSDWRKATEIALPHIIEKARTMRESDSNKSGRDDLHATALEYATALLMAVMERQKELPKPPSELL
jgi:hypothetical protein